MLRRVAISFWLGVLLAAPVAVNPGSAMASSCPTLPVTLTELMSLDARPGPLGAAFPLGVRGIDEHAAACYGRRELRFAAFVDEPSGIGGSSAYQITPRWMVETSLFLFDSRRGASAAQLRFFNASVRPGAGDPQRRYGRQWVTIRGHFHDSVAESCRASGPPTATPTTAQAIDICRAMFVLDAISPLETPDTSTATPAVEPSTGGRDPRWIVWPMGLVAAFSLIVRRSARDRRT